MDVAVLQQLQNQWSKGIKRTVFTYDINCKYKINIYNRATNNPYTPISEEFKTRLKPSKVSKFVEFKINTFHQRGHNPECADEHSIRQTPNVGRMTGEDIEAPWAKLNHLQYSTREMDAGARRDCITSHMIKQNCQKRVGLGKSVILNSR